MPLCDAIKNQAISYYYPQPEENVQPAFISQRKEALTKRQQALCDVIRNSDPHADYALASTAWQFYMKNQEDDLDIVSCDRLPEKLTGLCKAITADATKQNDARIHYMSTKVDVAEAILELHDGDMKSASHRQRRHALESCLRLLAEAERGIGAETTPCFRARVGLAQSRAFLYRGRMIRQKGFSIPEKKKAALLQAYELCREPGCFDDQDIDHCRLKAMIYLELIRIAALPDDAEEKDFFATAVLLIGDQFIAKNTIDSEILLRYAEIECDTSVLDPIIKEKNTVFPVAAARAVWLLKHQDKKEIIHAAITKTAHYPFSHPCWRDLTDLIRDMAKAQNNDWPELAVQLWRKCRAKERLTTHNCYLRWYWSHQLDLYDLAFHAALFLNKEELAAEVADSLKGRTAVHRQVLEEIGADDATIQEYLEAESIGYNGGFVHLRDENTPAAPPENSRLFSDLPSKDWLSVHFYISNGSTPLTNENGNGYALIYDKKTNSWAKEIFSGDVIWDVFRHWQNIYQQNHNKSAGLLVELAKVLGLQLAFLFNIEEGRSVVFVPYGFLHRLPLHMAIREEPNMCIWAAKHLCCFLPNWSLQKSTQAAQGSKVLLKHFPQFNYPLLNQGWDETYDNASAQQLIQNTLTPPPSYVAILTHGLAHPINPFASALIFAGTPLTLRDFLATSIDSMNLTGSSAFIGACEADMMLPQGALADEHLSFAGAFLQKGCCKVISGLYEVAVPCLQNCCQKTMIGGAPLDLAIWQQEMIKSQLMAEGPCSPEKFAENFYEIAPFRQLGLAM